ncbi:zinc-binding alcohol dehydrogenase [Roseomonas sp. SSH11]|uniref:Zinc-binding alcohol dehydrogenase n=1 Tax=Pararoseomonas baculiformis TaxID=2820812 RepID=A0ABS4AG33_9PROT|nr:zinc-binding alcohol dehydrogenase [Pararoseomonas baculiformis]MBP0445995.1 zinc-binding alcohol dehydrogenase [Pararoseomonas baculiformis]
MTAPLTATAFWTTGPGQGAIHGETLRPPGPGEVLVRTLASGISRGTERLVFQGGVPESEAARMRAPLQSGEFPWPVKYGYAAVGLVEDGPAEWIGQRVFCLHPHQDRFVAPLTLCSPVPDRVPEWRAVLAANMETALNVIWDAQPLPGERALVIGAGVVGLLCAWLLSRFPAMDLALADPDPLRAQVAQRLGLRLVAPGDAPDRRDLIIHASGHPDGLRTALRCAGFEARILEASWFGSSECSLPLGGAFHSGRVTLRSTQVGQVAGPMRGRRTHAERLALALSLLGDPALDALCGPMVPFRELPRAMAELLGPAAEGKPAPLCPVVTYDSDE